MRIYRAIDENKETLKSLSLVERCERSLIEFRIKVLQRYPSGQMQWTDVCKIEGNAGSNGPAEVLRAEIMAAGISAVRMRTLADIAALGRRLAQLGFEKPAMMPADQGGRP